MSPGLITRWVFLMCSSSGWMEEHEWNVHSFKFSSLVPHSKSVLRQKSNRNGSLKVWNYQLRLLSLRPPVGLLSKINDLLKHNSLLCCSSGSRRATKSLSWSCNWILRAQKHKQQSSWKTDLLTQHILKRPHAWWGCVNRLHETPARRWRSSSFCQILFSVKPPMHSGDLEVPRLCSHDNSPAAHEPWPLWLCSKNVCAPMNAIPNDATRSELKTSTAAFFSFSCVIQQPSLSDLNNNYTKRGPTDRQGDGADI